jgi:anti-sigma regulatory factor (Ser/Thr protein kinase)
VQTVRTFTGRLQTFAEVRAWAEAFAAAVGAERSAILRLVLVLEELFTNTVMHGYGARAQGPVWVTLASREGEIELTYEDAGPPFDPLVQGPTPRLDQPGPGGLGLALVRGLAASARYARVDGRNRVTLTVPLQDPPSPRAR